LSVFTVCHERKDIPRFFLIPLSFKQVRFSVIENFDAGGKPESITLIQSVLKVIPIKSSPFRVTADLHRLSDADLYAASFIHQHHTSA